MKSRALLMTVAKDGLFYCRPVQGSNEKDCPGATVLRVGRGAVLHK